MRDTCDKAKGLMRFGARDYDPHTSRWTTREPLRSISGMRRAILMLVLAGGLTGETHAATLRIRARHAEGLALPGVSVTCAGADPAERYTNADGEVVFQGVAPGLHRLKAELPGLIGVEAWTCVPPQGAAVALILNAGGHPCCITVTWTGEPPP